MLGAIIGDVVGSRFEWHNIKTKNFPLFTAHCRPTDDSIMTCAVADAILSCNGEYCAFFSSFLVKKMVEWGCQYPRAGYGGHFKIWLQQSKYSVQPPYNSFGNGSAMRVSPCGWAGKNYEEAMLLSKMSAEVTHNHPEGIKGANAVTEVIWMARHGKKMEEIRQRVMEKYYPLNFTLDEIRPSYTFDVTCQGSVPQAIEAFLESADFEDAIRNAVSIGGDSDTIAAITGSMAEAYYGIPEKLRKDVLMLLDDNIKNLLTKFENSGIFA